MFLFIFKFLYHYLYFSDETPTQKNSQDTVTYKVRRIGTDSSVNQDVDHPFATKWRWYWQDSFGMWRNYPANKCDVIDSNITCLSDDIEAKLLEYEYSEGNIISDSDYLSDRLFIRFYSCISLNMRLGSVETGCTSLLELAFANYFTKHIY